MAGSNNGARHLRTCVCVCDDQTTMGRPRGGGGSQLLLQLLISERDEMTFGVIAAVAPRPHVIAGRRTEKRKLI